MATLTMMDSLLSMSDRSSVFQVVELEVAVINAAAAANNALNPQLSGANDHDNEPEL